jgi:5S rRNA maturation endonuclease (ribonuclease M5)
MSSALPLNRIDSRRRGLIWLGDADPDGCPLNPAVKDLAYRKEADILRYLANEITDDAEVASLMEEAVYRTSKAANKGQLSDPAGYLYRTYTNLVDHALRRTVKAFGLEGHVLAEMASTGIDTEQRLVKDLTRQRMIDSMDPKERDLWKRHILGYGVDELAVEEGQDPDYLGKRLRRAAERALRRLLLKRAASEKSSVSDNIVAHE